MVLALKMRSFSLDGMNSFIRRTAHKNELEAEKDSFIRGFLLLHVRSLEGFIPVFYGVFFSCDKFLNNLKMNEVSVANGVGEEKNQFLKNVK